MNFCGCINDIILFLVNYLLVLTWFIAMHTGVRFMFYEYDLFWATSNHWSGKSSQGHSKVKQLKVSDFFSSSFFTKLASGKIFIYRRLLKMKPILIEYIQGLPLRTILLSFLFVCFTLFGTNMLAWSSTNLYWSVGVSNYTLFLATFWKITTDHFFSRNLFQSETTRYESIFKETE